MSRPMITPRQNPISANSPIAISPPVLVKLKTSGSNSAPSPMINIKTNSSVASPGSGIVTSKEWVLPPRPKPGRKPSVDTPASKRKAQNRAAQRAFRERRATRVQELEAKLLEVEKERDVKEMGLINTINKLKLENQYLVKSLEQMKHDISAIKQGKHASNLSPNHSSVLSTSPTNSTYSVQQISPAPSNNADSPPTNSSSASKRSYQLISKNNAQGSDFDCGVCLKDDCLCESVGIKQSDNNSLEEKISNFKPMQAVTLKKRKVTKEIDFTNKFKKTLPDFKKLKSSSQSVQIEQINKFDESSPVDNCGFCSDDTPCVCREAAKEAARLDQSLNDNRHEQELEQGQSDDDSDFDEHSNTLPPIQQSSTIRKGSLPVMHPGPTVNIRDITNLNSGQVVTPSALGTPAALTPSGIITPSAGTPTASGSGPVSKQSGCTGNPGTCEQCQMDPMSTLFCATVANKAKESNERESSRRPSSISKDSSTPSTPNSHINLAAMTSAVAANATNTTPSTPGGMFIPCADAYKTLSRHKKFNSVDFTALVGKLTTRGMQVEVQSVANVLRELDRRLYN